MVGDVQPIVQMKSVLESVPVTETDQDREEEGRVQRLGDSPAESGGEAGSVQRYSTSSASGRRCLSGTASAQ